MTAKFIKRDLQQKIESSLFKGKVIVIYGARQTGKTTLVNMIREQFADSLYLNCDEIDIRQRLTDQTSTELAGFLGNRKLVVLDEAQRVENIGLTLKLCADNLKNTQIIATGSSSFELSGRIKEPLTGRAREFYLYPFSINELRQMYQEHELSRIIEQRMIYGMYPEVILKQEPSYLLQLADSYVYKDVLAYQRIRNHEVLIRLLQALALQIGSEVSFTELSQTVGLDKKTVEHYISILEQAFIIFRLSPFSRNLRNELKKTRKIYFYDTGIRNALINNFNSLSIRQDTGALFENFVISERFKRNQNFQERKNIYFWRTHQQQEIDYIEEFSGNLNAYEIKFTKTTSRKPELFLKSYPSSFFQIIHKENILNFCR